MKIETIIIMIICMMYHFTPLCAAAPAEVKFDSEASTSYDGLKHVSRLFHVRHHLDISDLAHSIRDEQFGSESSLDQQSMLEKRLRKTRATDHDQYNRLQAIFKKPPEFSPRSQRMRFAKTASEKIELQDTMIQAFEDDRQSKLFRKQEIDTISLTRVLEIKKRDDTVKRKTCCVAWAVLLSMGMMATGISLWVESQKGCH